MIQDRFGRSIIDHGNGLFSIDGMTLSIDNGTIEHALTTFNGMAPEGWQEPLVQQPLDAAGVIATLNVVLGLWSLEDAANAVDLPPEDLIAEAQAWAVASSTSP